MRPGSTFARHMGNAGLFARKICSGMLDMAAEFEAHRRQKLIAEISADLQGSWAKSGEPEIDVPEPGPYR